MRDASSRDDFEASLEEIDSALLERVNQGGEYDVRAELRCLRETVGLLVLVLADLVDQRRR